MNNTSHFVQHFIVFKNGVDININININIETSTSISQTDIDCNNYLQIKLGKLMIFLAYAHRVNLHTLAATWVE